MRTRAVTVVVPTKDRFALLATTLRSVLTQTGVDVSVIVVEDGGDDGTTARLQGVDPRITAVRHERSKGVSEARNTGLSLVRTPWVAFVDDDDLWAPDKLARQLRAVEADPGCRWACSAAASFYADGAVAEVQPPPADRDASVLILRGNVVPGGGSGVLAEADLVREAGGFDPALSNLADWDCWLRLAQLSPVARVSWPDVGYRRHGTSMAHSVARSQTELEGLVQVYATLYERSGAEIDWRTWHWYLQRLTYNAGQWRAGTRRSWQLYREHGERRALLQPVFAGREVVRRREERRAARDWPQEHAYAREWLRPLLEVETRSASDAV